MKKKNFLILKFLFDSLNNFFQEALKEKKKEVKELTNIANKIKQEIEKQKEILEKKQDGKNQEVIAK